MAKIVAFGATGYTGDLVARALAEREAKGVVLAARTKPKVDALASELGFEAAVADVGDPASVAALVEGGDALATTVGPFNRWGDAAAEAAVGSGAHYIDSTGEGPFIRRVFEQYGPRAESSGSIMLTAFGYDWAPGNLAAATALSEGGEGAVSVDVGYFFTGGGASAEATSGGTRASMVDVMLAPGYAFRGGRLITTRTGDRHGSIEAGGKLREGISAGTTEAFSMPRLYPNLREVNVWLGWFGKQSKLISRVGVGASIATKVPGLKAGLAKLALRGGSSGGPSAEYRAKTGSLFAAEAHGPDGEVLARCELVAPNAYTLTGNLIAEAAIRLAAGEGQGSGALGPVEAFGLEGMTELGSAAGLERTV